MGRAPCCDKANVKKGPWSPEEDAKLKDFIHKYGTGGNWIALPTKAGLKRCGKSCRLRWLNYLRPNIKHGEFSDDEDRVICTLFASIGSRWSIIAAQLPGRTDNDIKNYWNTKLKKKLLGISPSQRRTHARLQHLQQQQQEHKPNIFTPPPPTSTTNTTTTSNISSLPPPQAPTPYLTSSKPFLSTPLDNIFSISQDVMTNYNTNNKNSISVGSSVLMFGGDLDQSCCTSSDGGSNLNIDYDSYGAHQVSLYQSLYNNVFGDQSQLRPLSGATETGVGSCQTQKGQKGLFDEASLDIDQFEIEGLKQLISPINDCNSNLFYDDPYFSSFKSMYY